jgi:hypothetical protein
MLFIFRDCYLSTGSTSHPASNVRCAKAACRPDRRIAHNRLGRAARTEQVPPLLLHRRPPDTVIHRRRRHRITHRAGTAAHSIIVRHGIACPIGPADAGLPLVGEAAELLEAGGGEADPCRRRRRRHLFSREGSGAAGFA